VNDHSGIVVVEIAHHFSEYAVECEGEKLDVELVKTLRTVLKILVDGLKILEAVS
jgi:hypothetical protein